MSVYVDDMKAQFGRMNMCHMIADSTDELVAMADKIGVARKWIQKAGTAREHFDICMSKKELAIAYGAVQITMRELAQITRKRMNLS
jgi:DNA/RNA endonuclease G (NUC1)